METKICKKCKIEKDVSFFGKNRQHKNGISNFCKLCNNKKIEKYRNSNKEKIKERKRLEYLKYKDRYAEANKKRREKNPEYNKKYLSKYYSENKEILKIKQKEYYENNKDIILEKQKNYILNNKDRRKKYHTEYREKFKNKLKNYHKEYLKNRRNNDILFKLKGILSHRVRCFLKSRDIRKNNRIKDIIGCDLNEFKIHIELQFKEGMSWDNYGYYGWHIDHKIPLASAKTEEEMYNLFHYSNLQPLWAKENFEKRDKIT